MLVCTHDCLLDKHSLFYVVLSGDEPVLHNQQHLQITIILQKNSVFHDSKSVCISINGEIWKKKKKKPWVLY